MEEFLGMAQCTLKCVSQQKLCLYRSPLFKDLDRERKFSLIISRYGGVQSTFFAGICIFGINANRNTPADIQVLCAMNESLKATFTYQKVFPS